MISAIATTGIERNFCRFTGESPLCTPTIADAVNRSMVWPSTFPAVLVSTICRSAASLSVMSGHPNRREHRLDRVPVKRLRDCNLER